MSVNISQGMNQPTTIEPVTGASPNEPQTSRQSMLHHWEHADGERWINLSSASAQSMSNKTRKRWYIHGTSCALIVSKE